MLAAPAACFLDTASPLTRERRFRGHSAAHALLLTEVDAPLGCCKSAGARSLSGPEEGFWGIPPWIKLAKSRFVSRRLADKSLPVFSTGRLFLGRVLDPIGGRHGSFLTEKAQARNHSCCPSFHRLGQRSAQGLPTSSETPGPVLQPHPAGTKSNVPRNPRALLGFELGGMSGAGDPDRSAPGPEAPRPISGLRTWHAK